jgi:threonine/homoserine/homoserine lactone efflux protein
MFEEYEKKRRKQISTMRSMMDYVMGFIIIIIGLFFLFRAKLGNIPINESLGQPDTLEKVFGGLCLLYGAWRIYRGYQKNYFR